MPTLPLHDAAHFLIDLAKGQIGAGSAYVQNSLQSSAPSVGWRSKRRLRPAYIASISHLQTIDDPLVDCQSAIFYQPRQEGKGEARCK